MMTRADLERIRAHAWVAVQAVTDLPWYGTAGESGLIECPMCHGVPTGRDDASFAHNRTCRLPIVRLVAQMVPVLCDELEAAWTRRE
jgi:hypothetical protein